MSDMVRVFRIIEYVGPRHLVESQIERSLQGVRVINKQGDGVVRITGTTLGLFPETLLSDHQEISGQEGHSPKCICQRCREIVTNIIEGEEIDYEV